MRLNSKKDFTWIVVENSPLNSNESLSLQDERFVVVNGIRDGQTSLLCDNPKNYGSYHHAAALNKALELISSRYVLFLDPDFFIVRPGWIQEVMTHMQMHNLSFFGAPYYPDCFWVYRYFPCGICLFVDLELVSKSKLDFTPDLDSWATASSLGWKDLLARILTRRKSLPRSTFQRITLEMALSALRAKLIRLGKFLGHNLGLHNTGNGRDTGYRICRTFSKSKIHLHECLMPVWKNPLYARPTSLREALWQRWIRSWIVPDKLSLYPKRKNYSTGKAFRDLGFPDIVGMGLEEYFWLGKPFGFHIGNNSSWRLLNREVVQNNHPTELISRF